MRLFLATAKYCRRKNIDITLEIDIVNTNNLNNVASVNNVKLTQQINERKTTFTKLTQQIKQT